MSGELRRRMRVPLRCTAALLLGLAVNVTLAATTPFAGAGYVEAAIAAGMVFTVLFYSMEVRHESPLVILLVCTGFMWLAILFAMTLLDYLTR